MPSGCLSHLTKEQPAHLDALRARLVEAAAAAATTKGRDAVLPERDASKKRQRLHALGKVSSSPAMEQAIVAMAGVRTSLAPITPAAAATLSARARKCTAARRASTTAARRARCRTARAPS